MPFNEGLWADEMVGEIVKLEGRRQSGKEVTARATAM
jgi:hypothetical protein